MDVLRNARPDALRLAAAFDWETLKSRAYSIHFGRRYAHIYGQIPE